MVMIAMILFTPMKGRFYSRLLVFAWMICALNGFIWQSPVVAGDDFVRRIVGGQEAEENEWPWMVALISVGANNPADGQFCGGALIHPWWVVTASHCLTAEAADSFEVAIGIHDLRNDPEDSYRRIAIQEVYLHPAYETGFDTSIDGDIALLRLAEPVYDIPVLPLVHQYELIRPGVNGTVVGWGLTTDGGQGSEVLLEVELPIVSHEVANATGAYDVDLSADMLPAGFIEGGKDSCQGDSGGPFVVPMENGEWGLAGVVSFGSPVGCAAPNAHGVYASVPYFFNELMSLMHSGFDQWRQENQVASILSDKDGDGAVDFAEFAFGSDPNNAADRPEFTFVQTSGPDGGIVPGIQFRQARSNQEVSYVVESSFDLITWFAVDDGDLGLIKEDQWVFKTANAISSQDTQFLRVRVEPSRDAQAPEFFQNAIRLKGNLNQSRDFVYLGDGSTEEVTLQYSVDEQVFEPKVTVIDEETGQVLATSTEVQEGEIRHTFTSQPNKLYRIQLSSVSGESTGAYHFNIPPIEPNDEGEGGEGGIGEAIAVGDVVEGVLEAADLIEEGIYGDDYQLTGVNAGDTLRITMKAGPENASFLPVIVVLNGDSFDEVVDSFDQEAAEVFVIFTVQEGVDYLISVGNLDENQIGRYTLTVELQ